MNLKYYQYKLGNAKLVGGEMHASLHSVQWDKHLQNSPFLKQIYQYLTIEQPPSSIIRKHILRGINIGDDKHTRFIVYPDFPFKSFEPSYFNQHHVEFGLSGGDFNKYIPNLLEEDYYFFYETKHPFSQWHKCEFSIDRINFSSAEQYMMFSKAKLFKDENTAKKILETRNVKKQKDLGRQVTNFDQLTWSQNAPSIVYDGNLAKFTQNEHFKEKLLATKGKTIVEASPYDQIWGIGLASDDENSCNIELWKGTNWLGIVLTEIREKILNNVTNFGYLTKDELGKSAIKSW